MQRTLIVVKPDGVKLGLVNQIRRTFERNGLKIAKKKNFTFTAEQAKEFYTPHIGKSFFNELVSFITSGPVFAAVVEGPDAIARARELIGPTDPAKAPKWTVRGQFGTGITTNIIHASDSYESFVRESKIVFG